MTWPHGEGYSSRDLEEHDAREAAEAEAELMYYVAVRDGATVTIESDGFATLGEAVEDYEISLAECSDDDDLRDGDTATQLCIVRGKVAKEVVYPTQGTT